MKIKNFLSLLNKVEQRSANQYMACCPAHNDHHPSLSIKYDNGKIIFHCFAGCKYEEVLNALGLKKSDLYCNDRGGKNCG
jgi:DNA primase